MARRVKHIVILGCGNVAWHIAKHLGNTKKFSISVYNHQKNILLKQFKTELNCKVYDSFNAISSNADYYIICVSDSFIEEVASKIEPKNPNATILHTSGSMTISALGAGICSKAVLYPLQTFSVQDTIQWETVPIILEGKDKESENKVIQLAKEFSPQTFVFDETTRLKFHLAAVLANNFSNSLYVAAAEILGDKNNFKLLLPLIAKTSEKLKQLAPRASQTGPAKRNDKVVMKKHLQLLKENSELKKSYKTLSKLIRKQQTKNAQL